MSDPFDRVVAREVELHEQEEAALESVRQSTLASMQGAVVFAFLLPVHLLVNGWTMTPLVGVHLVLLLLCAMATVNHWINQRRLPREV
jgi:TctA family transporter